MPTPAWLASRRWYQVGVRACALPSLCLYCLITTKKLPVRLGTAQRRKSRVDFIEYSQKIKKKAGLAEVTDLHVDARNPQMWCLRKNSGRKISVELMRRRSGVMLAITQITRFVSITSGCYPVAVIHVIRKRTP